MLRVQDVGEQGLLQRLQPLCPAEVIGDDGAVLSLTPGYRLVVTTDVLVDGVHFSDRTTPPHAVGWRAAAANLSDLAAMGAMPLGLTIALALPGETPVAWIEALYQGLLNCLSPFHCPIVGGDMVRSPHLTLSITAFGEVLPDRVIQRHTAQPGDAIIVTGVHGASRAGLELLLHPERGENLSQGDRAALIQAHQYPRPRLDVIPLLERCLESQPGSWGVTGMDSSDGFGDAIVQICRSSGMGAWVDRRALPCPMISASPWLSAETALEWALYGGEDFELVLCLAPNRAEQLVAALNPLEEGKQAAIVGQITRHPEVKLIDSAGILPEIPLGLAQGFQHW